MSNINIFSPNILKTFEECQQKFYYHYIEKIILPQKAANFEKGKKIHALANYYLNNFDITKLEKALSSDEKLAWKNLKANKYFKYNVINTEYNLSTKIDKYWIGGRLDALVKDDKNFYILDYKTGNIPQNAEYDFQTIVYLLCADKLLKAKGGYDSLKFLYLGLKNNNEKEIVLTEDLKKEYEEKIIKTCKKIEFSINSNVFEKNKDCSNCEYFKLCKF